MNPHSMMLEHEPVRIATRGRIYTSQECRRRLDLDGKGVGTRLRLGLVHEESRTASSPDGQLDQCGRYATTTVWIQPRGVFTVPVDVRDYLDIEAGDVVRMTARVQ